MIIVGQATLSLDDFSELIFKNKIFPKFIEDQPKYKDLARVKNFLESADHLNIFAK